MRRICSWHECRSPFNAVRDDKRYCSDNCRAKANKAKQKGEEAAVTPPKPPAAMESVAPPPPAPGNRAPEPEAGEWPDQGDYRCDEPQRIPKTPVGRIARLEERIKELEEDFDGAKPDRVAWSKARPRLDALLARPASTGPTADQITTLVRNEINATLAGWRDRIVGQDQAIVDLRGEVEKIGERVRGLKSASVSVAPPPPPQAQQVVAGTDRRVVAKLGEFEQSLAGVRQRLDSVESDVAEAWQAIFNQASGDEDEDDDAA